jgi:glycogen(starch) synthase
MIELATSSAVAASSEEEKTAGMKILFISNFYPPHHLGGYEMLCQEVATQLSARGHQITVLTSDYGTATVQEQPAIYRMLKLEADIHYYHPQQVLRYWIDCRLNRRAIEQVMANTAQDMVVIWGMWKLSQKVAMWAEEFAGSRIAYYFADEWPAEPSSHKAYWDDDARSALGRTFKAIFRIPVRLALPDEWTSSELKLEHVMVCSQAVRDKLLKAGIPVEHAKVIYHGINPQPYREARQKHREESSAKTLRVVYVGTLAPHKGVHTAVEAVGYLAEHTASVPVTLSILGAGHPDYEARLHELVKRWHLDSLVSFHSPIPRSQLPAFLAQFDVLAMPSVYEEPQARISQEAMAAGLVLVATLTGGTKEILVDGANGLAFEREDSKGLAGQLLRLARDADLRLRLSEAGWQTVKRRFTISRMIDELEDYLIELAGADHVYDRNA